MKILLVGPDNFSYGESMDAIAATLSIMGHETHLIKLKSFTTQCNYFVKRMHKLGNRSFLKNYEDMLNREILSAAVVFQPELSMFFNGLHMYPETLSVLRKTGKKTILILIDTVKGMLQQSGFEEILCCYDKIFSFDPDDMPFLQQRYNLNCEYFSNMYDSNKYYPDDSINKDIDISFVGTPYRGRLKILQHVADYCDTNNRKLAVYGKYWNEKYFWKKLVLQNKFKPLGKFVHNRIISPQEAAQIYRRSKICLNIHFNDQEGINIRTFDILGTKSFQLVDYKKQINELFSVGEELVTYNNIKELLYKIEEFLHDENKRKIIAQNGYEKAKNKFTVEKVMQDILARI